MGYRLETKRGHDKVGPPSLEKTTIRKFVKSIFDYCSDCRYVEQKKGCICYDIGYACPLNWLHKEYHFYFPGSEWGGHKNKKTKEKSK